MTSGVSRTNITIFVLKSGGASTGTNLGNRTLRIQTIGSPTVTVMSANISETNHINSIYCDRNASKTPKGRKKIRYPIGQIKGAAIDIERSPGDWGNKNIKVPSRSPAQAARRRLYPKVEPHRTDRKSLANENSRAMIVFMLFILSILLTPHHLQVRGYKLLRNSVTSATSSKLLDTNY